MRATGASVPEGEVVRVIKLVAAYGASGAITLA